ncbi:DUF5979 domain-containing protein [Xylanimonas allomyrinae]|uniref:DUF5979 domain-containing protein n=1 Tax=Xylanimonas allomyrinae TaxID=2509459 RepID=UPI0013A65D40|nr:DUF5979 domain-containing protein [Xylanimonas allomyrinae]
MRPQDWTAQDPEPSLRLRKVVVGDGSGLVDGGLSFTVTYQVNDGDPQQVVVTADGEPKPLSIEGLAPGDKVAFAEELPQVDGVRWQEPSFSVAGTALPGACSPSRAPRSSTSR